MDCYLLIFICAVALFPSWLPGMGFKRLATKWRRTITEFFDKPLMFVKSQMVWPPLAHILSQLNDPDSRIKGGLGRHSHLSTSKKVLSRIDLVKIV